MEQIYDKVKRDEWLNELFHAWRRKAALSTGLFVVSCIGPATKDGDEYLEYRVLIRQNNKTMNLNGGNNSEQKR